MKTNNYKHFKKKFGEWFKANNFLIYHPKGQFLQLLVFKIPKTMNKLGVNKVKRHIHFFKQIGIWKNI